MEFRQGEIVLLPLPFDDLTKAKTRPALIVSSNRFNQISRTVIVVEITSNLKRGAYTKLEIISFSHGLH